MTGVGFVTGTVASANKKSINQVRIGFVGVGGMGKSHVRNLVRNKGALVTAICDIDQNAA